MTKGGPTVDEAESFPLYAGQHDLVGEVLVWDNGLELCVKYRLNQDALNAGWLIYETHVDAATSLEGIPQKNGNPPPGQLRYGDDGLPGVTETEPYCIDFEDIIGFDEGEEEELCGTDIVIAAHAVVKKYEELDETCIDFENYKEKDLVTSESTPNGPVNFYMTSYASLKTLELDGYAALPNEGSPIVAAPGTTPNPPSDGYENIVAFTIFGDYSRDDEIDNDGGTGAGGNTLTDPQDLNQTKLMWHAYSQGLAIVIDVSSIDAVQGLDLAAIDLDCGEVWYFLYFNAANELIYKTVLGPATTQDGDGVAFAVDYPNPVSKIAIWGGMNQGQSEIVGYAIDNVCVTYLVEESETAWGDTDWEGVTETDFPGKNWATYINYNYTVECPECLGCPGIIDQSLNIELRAALPADVRVGQFENDDYVRVWKEFQGPLLADLCYDLDEGLSAITNGPPSTDLCIPAGTCVCIYYVHLDNKGPSSTVQHTGYIEFGTNILGLIISGGNLGDFHDRDLMFTADDQIGYPGTTYPTTSTPDYWRGFDVNYGSNLDDAIFIGPRVDFTMWVVNAHDSFRVILPMVPAPCE